jgi:hypothetical protein
MRNQTLSSRAAVKRCSPNFRNNPPIRVTAKAASTTNPQGPPPMTNPSAVRSAPTSPTSVIPRKRRSYGPPGSVSPTNRAAKDTLSQYLSWLVAASTTRGISKTPVITRPLVRLIPCRLTSKIFFIWLIVPPSWSMGRNARCRVPRDSISRLVRPRLTSALSWASVLECSLNYSGYSRAMGHTATCDIEGPHVHLREHDHEDDHERGSHGHSHGLVDRSIVESQDGVRTVSISLPS